MKMVIGFSYDYAGGWLTIAAAEVADASPMGNTTITGARRLWE
jgi:hypothetical protein